MDIGEEHMKRVAIITASDSGYCGEREDESGPIIQTIIEKSGYQVVRAVILPDEKERLIKEMSCIADEGIADLIITTGGTGCSIRDCMPEATIEVAERMIPGIGEAMRAYSLQFTKRAMLSRATAGIRKRTMIVNLPGSPKAVRECLEYIISELDHGVAILLGEDSNCARK